MSNLSFSKNKFVKTSPTKLSKPVLNNPNKLGRRTIEEIKVDMHSINKPKEAPKPKINDLQKSNQSNLSSLKAFKEWNRK